MADGKRIWLVILMALCFGGVLWLLFPILREFYAYMQGSGGAVL